MPDYVFLILLVAVTYLGFVLLALSQDRHWHHLGGTYHCPKRVLVLLRSAGYALLTGALVLAVGHEGAGFGSLLWATMLSIGAVAVVCTLTWRARWLRPLARLFHHI